VTLARLAQPVACALVGAAAAVGGQRLLPLDTLPVEAGQRVAVVVEGPAEVQVFRGRLEIEGGRYEVRPLPGATAPVRS
jgi:hypothetical protein